MIALQRFSRTFDLVPSRRLSGLCGAEKGMAISLFLRGKWSMSNRRRVQRETTLALVPAAR